MAEYSKPQISLLTEKAGSTPQIQAPTGSVVADVANLAATGLEIVSKQQATEALEKQRIAEKAYETKISSGIMKFRELRQAFIDQEVPLAQRRLREERFLRQFDPQTSLEIVSGTNKLTGMTGRQVDKAVLEEQNLKQEKMATGAAYAANILGYSAQDIDSASEEQLLAWENKGKRLDAIVAQQKSIIEVSDDITVPILTTQAAVFQERMQVSLQGIRDAQREGDYEKARMLGDNLRRTVLDTANRAPKEIRGIMESQGKGAFYDATLVDAYTNNVRSFLEEPSVKDVLSGKEVDEQTTNAAVGLINSAYSKRLLEITTEMKEGKLSKESINDFKNIVSFFANIDTTGLSITNKNEGTLLRAVGAEAEDPRDENNIDTGSSVGGSLFEYMTKGINYLTSLGTEDIKAANQVTSDYINTKLDEGKSLSELDMQWVVDSLTFGQNRNNEIKGKSASTQLRSPLSVLSRDDYSTSVKPLVDRQREQGVDVSGALVSALDNHIQNNFANAFTNLASLGTSGNNLSSTSKVSIDLNRPSLQAVTGKRDYDVKDIIELTQDNGKLKFVYKEGTLGTYTDAVKIQNLRNYNNTLQVINDFVSAMSNVNEVDKNSIALEVMYLLGEKVNIPLKSIE